MDAMWMDDSEQLRCGMVEGQVRGRGVADERVLAAMAAVPRHRFVPDQFIHLAYGDTPLPIGEGQTISQPFMVGLMLEALKLTPDDMLLEVGCGSGYAAATASLLCRQVYAIERHTPLADAARARLAGLGYSNVTVVTGDGTLGLPDAAPFDAVLVSAGGTSVPQPLLDQLAIGGRLVIPVGALPMQQQLLRILRRGEQDYERRSLGDVAFVPLVEEGDATER